MKQTFFFLTALWFAGGAATLSAQSTVEAGPLPQFNWRFFNKERWTADLAFSTEWNSARGTGGDWTTPGMQLQVINLQFGLAYQLTTDLNLALGYQFGIRDLDDDRTDLENRLLQQLTLSTFAGKYRFRGRFRTEQRLFRNEPQLVHRWRLRPSLDFPLQGNRLDPGEPYLNVQSEWLFTLTNPQPVYFRETRLYGGIGWQLGKGARLENGLEWRTRRADREGRYRSRLFLRVTFSWR